MTRYIDADALKRALVTNGFRNDVDMMMTLETINNAPTIDAEPVRRGKWRFVNCATGLRCQCSECGCVFEEEEPTYRYCPNCGARMDKNE